MSEESSIGSVAAHAQPQPKLLIHSQFLQDLSFENPNGLESLSKTDQKPEMTINLNVDSRKVAESAYEISLRISVSSEIEKEPWFIVEIDYRGIISVSGVEEESVAQVLLIEGPRLLYPFARRIVADSVRDGGFPPLMLEPVDFVGLYRQHLQSRARNEGNGKDEDRVIN